MRLKPVEHAGERFGRLVAIKMTVGGRHSKYLCRCDCGKEKEIHTSGLVGGRSLSCGCLASELTSERSKTHGMSHTSEYRIWAAIKRRCVLKTCKEYPRYGGRGIKVSQEWHNFSAFINDMGRRPSPDLEIDRINNDGNYEPTNCRWATVTENARNRCDNHVLEFNGLSEPIIWWAQHLGLRKSTISFRLRSGWTVERALTAPVRVIKAPIDAFHLSSRV